MSRPMRANSPLLTARVRVVAGGNPLTVPRAALWEAVAEAVTLGAVALLALTALVFFG